MLTVLSFSSSCICIFDVSKSVILAGQSFSVSFSSQIANSTSANQRNQRNQKNHTEEIVHLELPSSAHVMTIIPPNCDKSWQMRANSADGKLTIHAESWGMPGISKYTSSQRVNLTSTSEICIWNNKLYTIVIMTKIMAKANEILIKFQTFERFGDSIVNVAGSAVSECIFIVGQIQHFLRIGQMQPHRITTVTLKFFESIRLQQWFWQNKVFIVHYLKLSKRNIRIF